MWEGLLPGERIAFPPDFIWGVASSAYQCEGRGVANDYDPMIDAGFLPPNPGNGFPEARFGLIGLDPRTFERSVKPSGAWLARVIADGALDPAGLPQG